MKTAAGLLVFPNDKRYGLRITYSSRLDYTLVCAGLILLALMGGCTTTRQYGESTILSDKATWTTLASDNRGKVFLFWDQSNIQDVYSAPEDNSDIMFSYSKGTPIWETPAACSISSPRLDMNPIIQRNSKGKFWLLWCSNRDPEFYLSFWISSSANGKKWRTPERITIPFKGFKDIKSTSQLRQNKCCFAIDRENQFWISWFGRYYLSKNAEDWEEMDISEKALDPDLVESHPDCIGFDYQNQLILLQHKVNFRTF